MAAGTVPLSYQWSFNGAAISGATASSLNVPNIQPANAGTYTVMVTNVAGMAPGGPAVLTMNSATVAWAPGGLLGWWRGEWDATDALGTNNGSLNGGVTFVPGKVGQAFNLDGSTGYIKIPASASLTMSGASGLTMECWIKPADFNVHPLIEWNNAGYYGAQLWINGNPQSLFANFVDTVGGWHYFGALAYLLTTNDFQHVAATYDQASGGAVIYYNGVSVATASLSSFTPLTSYDLYLGFRPGSSYYYNGLMDEVGRL